jgi:hypothetical protein
MASGRDDEIRKRAHEIWENEGRPEGREKDHWERAEREVAASAGAKPPAAKKSAGSDAKAAAPKKASATKPAGSHAARKPA